MLGGVIGPVKPETTPQETLRSFSKRTYSTTKDRGSQECVYHKKNVGEDQNQKVAYASKISNNNLDFLATVNHENGLWSIDRRSTFKGASGHYAYGICQFYWTYHKDFIQSEDFKDYKKQIDRCWDIWKTSPTRFNAYTNGMYRGHLNSFELKCS